MSKHKAVIKVKLTSSHLQGLHNAYSSSLSQYNATNSHEQLLFEHAAAMYEKLALMNIKNQYTLALTAVEALAYYQFWYGNIKPLIPYCSVPVQKVFACIDQEHISHKTITNY